MLELHRSLLAACDALCEASGPVAGAVFASDSQWFGARVEALGGAANGGDEVSAAGAADGSADGEICGECETGEGADDGGGGDGRGGASAQPVVAPAPSPLTRQPSWCNTEQGASGRDTCSRCSSGSHQAA